jgi:hypothetical protein
MILDQINVTGKKLFSAKTKALHHVFSIEKGSLGNSKVTQE